MNENVKNSVVQIQYNQSNEPIGAKFNDIVDRTNTYLLEPGKVTNISTEDFYCKYNISINNISYVPLYKLSVWYDVLNDKCVITNQDSSLAKFLTYSTVQKESAIVNLTTQTPSWIIIIIFLFTIMMLWIVFMNWLLNKKSKYLGVK